MVEPAAGVAVLPAARVATVVLVAAAAVRAVAVAVALQAVALVAAEGGWWIDGQGCGPRQCWRGREFERRVHRELDWRRGRQGWQRGIRREFRRGRGWQWGRRCGWQQQRRVWGQREWRRRWQGWRWRVWREFRRWRGWLHQRRQCWCGRSLVQHHRRRQGLRLFLPDRHRSWSFWSAAMGGNLGGDRQAPQTQSMPR